MLFWPVTVLLILALTLSGCVVSLTCISHIDSDLNGKCDHCGIEMEVPRQDIESIEVTQMPTKTYYARDEVVDVTGGVIDALRETYMSWANADAGTKHPERPAVGIVDYPESATASEFADIVERLADEGVFARLVDIRDLRIEEAGGHRRLVDSQGPIACVYRRALLSEMVEKPGRVELEESIRYLEGIRARREFDAFKDWALRAAASEMLARINRPIAPR